MNTHHIADILKKYNLTIIDKYYNDFKDYYIIYIPYNDLYKDKDKD